MDFWLRCHDKRLRRATTEYLRNLRSNRSGDVERNVLQRLRALPQPVHLGESLTGDKVEVPMDLLVNFSVTTGSQGSGKTMFISRLIMAMLQFRRPFGLIDAKGDLFDRAIYLISGFPEVWKRVVVIDFNNRDIVSPYNILVPQGDDLDYFLTRRLETLKELLPADDSLSLRGTSLLKQVIALLAELRLPAPSIERVLTDARFRARLLRQCANPETKWYFHKIFPTESQATIGAVRARMSSLFASESIKLSLGGNSSPDFRNLQDRGNIVLVNCAGPRITRGVRLFLLALTLSDIRQSIFERTVRTPYLWFVDEAQNLFRTPSQQEDVAEVLNTGRSFGTFFHFITQHLETAISKREIADVLHQNLTWSFTLRSNPKDCSFLQPVLPVTGRRLKASRPFQEPELLTRSEEQKLLYEGIAQLPNRTGYLFLKAHAPQAIPLKTVTVEIGEDFEDVVSQMKQAPEFGARALRQAADQEKSVQNARDVFARMEENYPDPHE